MARFVRLAGESVGLDDGAEHLRAPVVLRSPPNGSAKLGYAQQHQDNNNNHHNNAVRARDEVLVRGAAGRSLLRPVLEGALGVALISILMGSLSDMTGSSASSSASSSSSSLSPAVGAVLSALLCMVGFQGVRGASPLLLRLFALGELLLLSLALLLGLPGVLARALLHCAALVLAVALVRLARPRTYIVDTA